MEDKEYWSGRPLAEIYRNLDNQFELDQVARIIPSGNHTVLYKFPHRENTLPIPFVTKRRNKNDFRNYVILPNSTKIQSSLLKLFQSSLELEQAILNYNSKIGKLKSLHVYCSQLNDEDSIHFFNILLPKIIYLALLLPNLVGPGIPLLKQDQNHSISLSQQQIACVLANAFLCTFPRRRPENNNYSEINFNRLFESDGLEVIEKIKCIINYFDRVTNKTPTGVVTFIRRSINQSDFPDWSKEEGLLSATPLHLTSRGTIEDQGKGLLQVIFANNYVGGRVLGRGCVQENIRFIVFPELIISKLFTESLKDNEALIVIGAERYSKYVGYGSSFKFDGNYIDETPIDDRSNRRKSYIVAIDAQHYLNPSRQYEESNIRRELNKAYVGFYRSLNTLAPGVATGNWGCGAYGGDLQLKALIQLMACTITERSLLYFTFGDRKLQHDVYQIYRLLIQNNVKIQQLYRYLNEYQLRHDQEEYLFEFIRKHLEIKNTINLLSSHPIDAKKNETSKLLPINLEEEEATSHSDTESSNEGTYMDALEQSWTKVPSSSNLITDSFMIEESLLVKNESSMDTGTPSQLVSESSRNTTYWLMKNSYVSIFGIENVEPVDESLSEQSFEHVEIPKESEEGII